MEKNKLTPQQKTWNVRYTIRHENGSAILYRDEKKIAKKEELFLFCKQLTPSLVTVDEMWCGKNLAKNLLEFLSEFFRFNK